MAKTTLENHVKNVKKATETAAMATANGEVPFDFKRGKRLGMNILELTENDPTYVEVRAFDIFKSTKYPDGIPYWDVVNLKTGEEQRMWLDGGLRGAFSNAGGFENAVGKQFEITKREQKTIEVVNEETGKPEKVKVNTYDVFQGE